MNEVLLHLCRNNVSIMNCGIPIPSTILSEVCELSLYKTRKELNRLRDLGLVKTECYCHVGEDANCLVRGWVVTEEGKKTEEYKKAWEEERKAVKESFEFDIGECI